ncbi:hypothetical protein JI721_03920 [Alicyclobacillus cycloheptanicus]|uniref:N-acetylneuraminic acid mutarotase n=1 Tax=Alicyclobacillus cycloheptanicus TaxID=1457 RepID=A0ABT9XMT7_9BACL|nr:kelch repeat-containing protein [Alicyclobacillus cycloheptanicus]MDQ0191631.1 N-acetylneuraminic acid mutarotase [Alicyclobacillus cycloheptanicus]WDM01994.1 hypothetical protein JI721_03920 [Alicyclobacillus cycloheptanicus]
MYVFGGGQSWSYDTIIRVRPGAAEIVGSLPNRLSDAVSIPYVYNGQRGLLLIGGYDGKIFNRVAKFVSVQGRHLHWQTLFTLPEGLRYPAVASTNGKVFIAGGQTASGGLSDDVYVWSSGSNEVRHLATLPSALDKAAAFAAGSMSIVIAGGNRADGQPTDEILAMNVKTGAIKQVGKLPSALADMGYTQVGSVGYIAGGVLSSGQTNSEVWKVLMGE